MFDIDALEAAGFEKVLTTKEWEATVGNPLVNYRLQRGEVLITTEQNTHEQAPANGLSTIVRYPEIAIVENLTHINRRVTCDAADTQLILALADEVAQNSRKRTTNG